MIQSFRVKNILSIRDEQVLNFVATSDDTYEDICLVNKGSVRLQKLNLIYGANASGKSNVLIALSWLLRFIIGKIDKEDDSYMMLAPFLLDDKSREEPTEMGLVFWVGDVKCEYSVSILEDVVQYEKMVHYPLGRAALIYERRWNRETTSSEITIGSTLKVLAKQKYVLEGQVLPHLTVLGAYKKSNIERINLFEDLYAYFSDRFLPILARDSEMVDFANKMVKKFPEVKAFITKILQLADFNISDIVLKEEIKEIPEEIWREIQQIPSLAANMPERTVTEDRLYFEHTTPNHTEELLYNNESVGTNRMYGLAAYLFFLIIDNEIMLADEIESSLHYDLLRYFISLFLMNSDGGQIICSTHSILLLDEPFVRRDSIHICRKSANGNTEVVRASDFGLRKDVSILNAYREGKLGGMPKLGGLVL